MTTTEILSELRSQYNCFDEMEEPVYHALSKAIKAVSAQPYDYSDGYADGYKQGRKDAQPERTGKWILVKGSNGKDYHKCSECLHTQEITGVKNYCAVCGAEMREPEDIPMEYFESGGM